MIYVNDYILDKMNLIKIKIKSVLTNFFSEKILASLKISHGNGRRVSHAISMKIRHGPLKIRQGRLKIKHGRLKIRHALRLGCRPRLRKNISLFYPP